MLMLTLPKLLITFDNKNPNMICILVLDFDSVKTAITICVIFLSPIPIVFSQLLAACNWHINNHACLLHEINNANLMAIMISCPSY